MDGVMKEETLPPGFRFHPNDEELVGYYLTNKISDTNFTCRAIADVDLNKCEPWDLPGKAKMGEKEWYFFSLRDRKYPTGLRTNRATDAGYWKTTGKDKEIFNSVTSELIGMKKTLVFYRGRAPKGEKTNWVMHEYRIQPKTAFKTAKDEWVVCRVFQKSSGVKKYPPTQNRTNPYNQEMGHTSLSSLLQQQHNPSQFTIGRNCMSNADLAELSRVMRNQGNMTLQSQPQFGFPGNFSLPGLNLNLPSSQPVVRTPMVAMNPQLPHMDASSSLLNGCVLTADGCFGGELNPVENNRFHPADGCVDLESYWPNY